MKAENFQGTVEMYKKLRHIRTQEDLRAHTSCGSSTTFRKYFRNPDLMPIGLFTEIMDSLNVPHEERMKLFK